MITILILSILAQTRVAPGPIDAFRANHAAIQADLDFTITHGMLDSSMIADNRPWEDRTISFTENQRTTITGTWSCFDEVEYYLSGSPDSIIAEAQTSKDHQSKNYSTRAYTPRVECLFDGVTLAEHLVDVSKEVNQEKLILVWSEPRSNQLVRGKGPFSWWDYSFPSMLRVRFQDVTPRIARVIRCGVPTEVEIYIKPSSKGWLRLEVAYDPAVGYLPRHTRYMSFTDHIVYVRESFLVKTQHCASGGYVPTEWYTVTFQFDRFESDYPSYDESTVLTPPKRTVYGQHFLATSFKNRSTEVAMTYLKHVSSLSAPGGVIALRPTPSRLSMSDIKRRLGRLLTEPIRIPLPTIDVAELNEFNQPNRSWWGYLLMGAALVGLSITGIVIMRQRFWHRQAAMLLIAIAAGLSGVGCGKMGPPIVRLTGVFENPTFLYDGGPGNLTMSLVARNEGNQPIRILRVDGGCSCRQVDQSPFPRDLPPGDQVKISLTYNPGRGAQPQFANFTFETDHGNIPVATSFYPLPRHQLDPEAPGHLSIGEDASWEFELTHRAIFEDDRPPEELTLVVPPAFTARQTDLRSARIEGAPGFSYKDVTYIVTLAHKEMGLYKEAIYLTGPGNSKHGESSVVWKRVPFLSSVPERVVLGEKAARVFLRCPDESVELTHVISAPPEVGYRPDSCKNML